MLLNNKCYKLNQTRNHTNNFWKLVVYKFLNKYCLEWNEYQNHEDGLKLKLTMETKRGYWQQRHYMFTNTATLPASHFYKIRNNFKEFIGVSHKRNRQQTLLTLGEQNRFPNA